jgi:hypothetical protein
MAHYGSVVYVRAIICDVGQHRANDGRAPACRYLKQGDAEAMAADCADPTRVLDGLAPHVWRGLQLAGGTGTSSRDVIWLVRARSMRESLGIRSS